MTLKIKDNKIIWTKLCFRQFYITRKFELQGSFCGQRIRIRYFPGSGSGRPKKTGSATLLSIHLLLFLSTLKKPGKPTNLIDNVKGYHWHGLTKPVIYITRFVNYSRRHLIDMKAH